MEISHDFFLHLISINLATGQFHFVFTMGSVRQFLRAGNNISLVQKKKNLHEFKLSTCYGFSHRSRWLAELNMLIDIVYTHKLRKLQRNQTNREQEKKNRPKINRINRKNKIREKENFMLFWMPELKQWKMLTENLLVIVFVSNLEISFRSAKQTHQKPTNSGYPQCTVHTRFFKLFFTLI